jgi:hypothetical protein
MAAHLLNQRFRTWTGLAYQFVRAEGTAQRELYPFAAAPIEGGPC